MVNLCYSYSELKMDVNEIFILCILLVSKVQAFCSSSDGATTDNTVFVCTDSNVTNLSTVFIDSRRAPTFEAFRCSCTLEVSTNTNLSVSYVSAVSYNEVTFDININGQTLRLARTDLNYVPVTNTDAYTIVYESTSSHTTGSECLNLATTDYLHDNCTTDHSSSQEKSDKQGFAVSEFFIGLAVGVVLAATSVLSFVFLLRGRKTTRKNKSPSNLGPRANADILESSSTRINGAGTDNSLAMPSQNTQYEQLQTMNVNHYYAPLDDRTTSTTQNDNSYYNTQHF